MNYTLRPAYEHDIDYILKAWTGSAIRREPFRHHTPWAIFKDEIRKRILRLLTSGARCIIASNPDNLDEHIGFICFSNLADKVIVHYIYTQAEHRKKGFAKILLAAADREWNPFKPIFVTTMTKQVSVAVRKQQETDALRYRITYVPYIESELIELFHNTDRRFSE